MARNDVLTAADPTYLAGAVTSGVKRIAQGLYRITRSIAPLVWQGQGYSTTGGPEHAAGRALDLIVSSAVGVKPTATEKAQGDKLAAWLIGHRTELRVLWIIWYGRIWNPDKGGWRAYTAGSGTTGGHYDHLHVYFGEGADWPSRLDQGDDMAVSDADAQKIAEKVWAQVVQSNSTDEYVRSSFRNNILHQTLWMRTILGLVQKIAKKVGA